MQLFFGFIFAIIIAYAAQRARSLNRSGAVAATVTGTIIFGLGGLEWAVLLLTFFITSSALSRAFKKRKEGLDEKFSKGHERDAGQVFGNGGIATACAVLYYFFPTSPLPWLGFAAALAAVNADTWGTELGVLNPQAPRMITNLRKTVEKGTSGGISWVGTLASLAGSGLIGLLAMLPAFLGSDGWQAATHPVMIFMIVSLSGFAGALFDSWLGATVQAMYYCPLDAKETEKHPLHSCGTPTKHIRGWRWLDNDRVNLLCGALGATMALVILSII